MPSDLEGCQLGVTTTTKPGPFSRQQITVGSLKSMMPHEESDPPGWQNNKALGHSDKQGLKLQQQLSWPWDTSGPEVLAGTQPAGVSAAAAKCLWLQWICAALRLTACQRCCRHRRSLPTWIKSTKTLSGTSAFNLGCQATELESTENVLHDSPTSCPSTRSLNIL